jgi:predicted choloylglycine hydrolase
MRRGGASYRPTGNVTFCPWFAKVLCILIDKRYRKVCANIVRCFASFSFLIVRQSKTISANFYFVIIVTKIEFFNRTGELYLVLLYILNCFSSNY